MIVRRRAAALVRRSGIVARNTVACRFKQERPGRPVIPGAQSASDPVHAQVLDCHDFALFRHRWPGRSSVE